MRRKSQSYHPPTVRPNTQRRNPLQASDANSPNVMTSRGQMGSRFALTVEDASAALWMISVRRLGSVSANVVLIATHRAARAPRCTQ